MRITRKPLLVVALSAGLLASSATAASAYGSYGDGSYGSYGGELKAASYINRDTGAATQNDDVNANSSCKTPDQYDMQQFTDATKNRNVHNDACFLDRDGNKRGAGISATFQSTGTGFIVACPDPDGAGPETSRLSDLDGADGRNDSCFQSSYQDRGVKGVADVAGDFEYHARLNNTGMAGSQKVKWGMDSDKDGRIDGWNNDDIKIDWSKDGLSSFSSYSW